MKLLLTSSGWEKSRTIGREFLKLVDKKPADIKIFIVITPTKFFKRSKYIIRQFKQFKGIKIPEKNITFFQLDKKAKKSDLKGMDVVFIFGGNSFEYLDRIKRTGLDKIIKAFVKKGGVYLGLSAGSYVAGPTIETACWKQADRNITGLKNLRGLNLVPFLITAHFREEVRLLVENAARKSSYQVVALSDKQAVLINGKSRKIIGTGRNSIYNIKKDYWSNF